VIVQSGDKGQVTDQVTKRLCDIKKVREIENKMGAEPDHNTDDPEDLPPEPKKTQTWESRSGFHWVRVGVALILP